MSCRYFPDRPDASVVAGVLDCLNSRLVQGDIAKGIALGVEVKFLISLVFFGHDGIILGPYG
jgi:hypothetical protein